MVYDTLCSIQAQFNCLKTAKTLKRNSKNGYIVYFMWKADDSA